MSPHSNEPIFQTAIPSDYDDIAAALHSWWTLPDMDTEAAARERAAMLPRLWLQHFPDSSLVARDNRGNLLGFLVGFLSPKEPNTAYIHFVGVAPQTQGTGLGKMLYRRFFSRQQELGATQVKAITSPQNTGSIGFHLAMGFEQGTGNAQRLGQPVELNYDGPGLDRCTFTKIF